MADHYGIGPAITGAAEIYFRTARGTGRTQSLVESLKNGDRVVFTNDREAKRVAHLCRERGLTVTVAVCDPHEPQGLFNKQTPRGRTVFDHSWVEEYYRHAISMAFKEIRSLQTQLSGFGAAHIETQQQVEAMRRWSEV